jgi:exodeoxyribonuclease V beta subunit
MTANDPGHLNAQEDFNPLDFPLSGRRLIEASAGTGKTYNIANLFLRLILGHGIEQPLEVDQILVVTFTRAATSELRRRIRARVEQAFQDFRRGHSEEAEISALIPDAEEERTRLIRLLNEAILRMDEACISTIHSFAVQAAKTFLFETGAIADIEISEYGETANRQIIADHYRYLATLRGEFAEEFKALVLAPNKLREFQNYYKNGLPLGCRIEAETGRSRDLGGLYDQYRQQRSDIERAHQDFSQEWKALFIRSPGVEHKANCVDFADRFNENLHDEFRRDFQWARSATNLANFIQGLLRDEGPNYVESKAKYFTNWMEMPEEAGDGECFNFVIRLREQFRSWFDLQSDTEQAGRQAILESLQAKQAEIPLDQMSLDDVIRLINQKLDDDRTADALRQIITQTYPACLVDEFQDTDPEQFLMFNRIYKNAAKGAGFFMIGDPKQSIYSFRGADIFSYLKVRSSVRDEEEREGDRKIFSLGTNWRSKKALVDATNRLFREPAQMESAPVFLFRGIDYQAVNSCEDTRGQTRGTFSIGKDCGLSDKSLVFVGNQDSGEESKIDGSMLRRKYARDTAARISALLSHDSGGRITDEEGVTNPVAPGDIAVLVRSGFEARHIREELAQPAIGIRSVYLSQRDSVFAEAEVSEDLFHVLIAMHECTDKNRLKAALATPLLRAFAFKFDELDQLENNENDLEALIEEFSAYRQLWRQHGILTALNHMLVQRGLFAAIATRQDSDRVFTDLRHLGDLLQQQDMQSGSAEQLIDWYASQLSDDSLLDEDSKRIRLESDEDLVKIVTIFVAKGLEYPVVFLPFFFFHRPINLKKNIPLYHDQSDDFRAVIDLSSNEADIEQRMAKENLAENMRLFYVAVTRAIYQCYIGISASTYNRKNVFTHTHWAHLLGIEEPRPAWATIQAALEQRFGEGQSVDYRELGDVAAQHFIAAQSLQSQLAPPDPSIRAPESFWQIASYSRLAHGSKFRADDKGDDEVLSLLSLEEPRDEPLHAADDERWADDVRYTLKGSSITGTCLHDIFESYGLEPGADFGQLVEKQLSACGLDKPARPRTMGESEYSALSAAFPGRVAAWLLAALVQPLENPVIKGIPSLKQLFSSREVIPELAFDFAIGSASSMPLLEDINQALLDAGLAGLEIEGGKIHGLMTGAIDLVFEHDQKIYVLDYKSNTLGKAPRFYDQDGMTLAMTQNRFDLQYMIYSTAVHRYFSSRFAKLYSFDEQEGKSLSFGGVFYLFLRGMGLSEKPYRQHGVWFTRPQSEHISALERAFGGSGDGGQRNKTATATGKRKSR